MKEAGKQCLLRAKYLSYMHHYLTLLSLHPDNCARRATERMGPIVVQSFSAAQSISYKDGTQMGTRTSPNAATVARLGRQSSNLHSHKTAMWTTCDPRPQLWHAQSSTLTAAERNTKHPKTIECLC